MTYLHVTTNRDFKKALDLENYPENFSHKVISYIIRHHIIRGKKERRKKLQNLCGQGKSLHTLIMSTKEISSYETIHFIQLPL